MSILETVQVGTSQRPRRTMLYGTHGVGKSTWASMAPSPIFIQTEDGLDDLDTAHFPKAESFTDVLDQIGALYGEDHQYQTVVIDSLDWLERMIWDHVCAERSVKSIEDIGYAKGYHFALIHWRSVLDGLDALRDTRGMDIILLAHSTIRKFDNPETEAYDRYEPALHKHASAIVQEWCQEVLFASYQVATKKEDQGFNKTRTRAIDAGERILRTRERPSHLAKRRLNLPDELPLDYRVYAEHITKALKGA